MNKEKVAGVVLAGGQSRRMGEDKANLRIAQQTFLLNAQDLLVAHLGAEQVFISGRAGKQSIFDSKKGLGPIGGILSSLIFLSQQRFQYVLFVPVDMPLLTQEIICSLLVKIQKESILDCVYYQACYLPMFVKISKVVIDCIKNQIDKKQYALFQLVTHLNSMSIPSQKLKQQLQNINTWDDYLQISED